MIDTAMPRAGVRMNHALCIWPRRMNCTVNDKTRTMNKVRRVTNQIAVKIDLDQCRCTDLVKHVSERVQQKVFVRARYPRRNMCVDQIGPAVLRRQPITGGQINAGLPLRFTDPGTNFSSPRCYRGRWWDQFVHSLAISRN